MLKLFGSGLPKKPTIEYKNYIEHFSLLKCYIFQIFGQYIYLFVFEFPELRPSPYQTKVTSIRLEKSELICGDITCLRVIKPNIRYLKRGKTVKKPITYAINYFS